MVNTHGAMDENHDYFLATYDMDFNNAKGKGLPYSDLESIFDETKARNRLVLIDACNAGEIDKKEIDDLMRLSTLPDAHLKIKKQFSNSEFNHIGYQESFELMKDLFIDLRRNSGATIIASARNAEFALEGSQYTGGVFTSALLQGLTSGAADLNKKDGKVTISELQEYLSRKVAYETLNQQRPVHRVENIGNDWQIW